jgi:hypothetical protein
VASVGESPELGAYEKQLAMVKKRACGLVEFISSPAHGTRKAANGNGFFIVILGSSRMHAFVGTNSNPSKKRDLCGM